MCLQRPKARNDVRAVFCGAAEDFGMGVDPGSRKKLPKPTALAACQSQNSLDVADEGDLEASMEEAAGLFFTCFVIKNRTIATEQQ